MDVRQSEKQRIESGFDEVERDMLHIDCQYTYYYAYSKLAMRLLISQLVLRHRVHD